MQYPRLPEPQTPEFPERELSHSGVLLGALVMCSEMIVNVLHPFGHNPATLTSVSKDAQNFFRSCLIFWCTLLPNSLLYKLGKRLHVSISKTL